MDAMWQEYGETGKRDAEVVSRSRGTAAAGRCAGGSGNPVEEVIQDQNMYGRKNILIWLIVVGTYHC